MSKKSSFDRSCTLFFDMILSAKVDYMESLDEDRRNFCTPVISVRTEKLYSRYRALYDALQNFGWEQKYIAFIKSLGSDYAKFAVLP